MGQQWHNSTCPTRVKSDCRRMTRGRAFIEDSVILLGLPDPLCEVSL
jgi:hypothetical protein